jgi:hypothetical protein
MDHVPVVDHVAVPAVGLPAPASQRELVGAAEENLEPVIEQPDPQAVADQARGHAVEHLAQHEATGGGHGDDRLLVVGGAARRQVPEGGALDLDARRHTCVAPADHLVDEAPVGGEVGEVARAAQQPREPRSSKASAIAALRWPCAPSMAPFSCGRPGLLRLGAMP